MADQTIAIPKGWKASTLEEVVAKASTGADAIKRAPIVNKDTGVKCLRIQDVSQKKEYKNWGFTSVSDGDFKKFQLKKGELFIARTGASIGANLIINKDLNAVFNNGLIRIRVNEKSIPDYVSYLLFSKFFKDFILSISQGTSTQPNIQIGALLRFPIMLPPLSEQNAIISVLSSLDDKIELLREQNKTLEAVAQAIFKEWFVKFRFPGHEKVKMVDSALGKIPEGWRVGKLEELVNLTIGRTPPRKESEWFSVNPKDIKWLSIKDLGNAGTYVYKTSEYLTRDAIQTHKIQIVPINTVLISFKLTVGRVAITLEKMATNEAIAHLRLTEHSELNTEYLYLYFKTFDFNSIGSTSSIATAFNSESLRALDVLIPEKIILKNFTETISPIFKKTASNTSQIQTLSKLRDTLLPKLMKGEVRVKYYG